MYRVIKREIVAPGLVHMVFHAPQVARSARPGQFIIIRLDERGERIPMGLAGWDVDAGTVDIILCILGSSTMKLARLKKGAGVLNLSGPLGTPSEIDNYGRVLATCGCFGLGPSLPLIRALKEAGNYVITVVEAQEKRFVFWEDRLREASHELYLSLERGGSGEWTDCSQFIQKYLGTGHHLDRVYVHGGPLMMMKVSSATKSHGVKTIASLTPIMVDGTGMCGACRVEVAGRTRFACVDGPDFDGHEVNWEGLISRLRHGGVKTPSCSSRKVWGSRCALLSPRRVDNDE